MPRIVDLSYPIEDHFRWKVERGLTASFEQGARFEVTRIGLAVHGFTHVDAPRHISPDGATTSELRLESLVGQATVIDLTEVEPNTAIGPAELAGADPRPGDIVLLSTGWDQRRSLSSRAFWTDAPYLTREACELLLERKPAAVGFDFPQDEPIRDLLSGDAAPIERFVSHDVLLRRGVPLIEYLRNLAAIEQPRPQLCALPIKLPDADGAPARVIAIEPDAETPGRGIRPRPGASL